jgi:anti-sigma-K factor RskA
MALPPDLPDDPVDAMPVFTSRRKAEALPPLRPAAVSNRLDAATERGADQRRAGWHSGFRWGLIAAVGGTCLVITLAVGMRK